MLVEADRSLKVMLVERFRFTSWKQPLENLLPEPCGQRDKDRAPSTGAPRGKGQSESST